MAPSWSPARPESTEWVAGGWGGNSVSVLGASIRRGRSVAEAGGVGPGVELEGDRLLANVWRYGEFTTAVSLANQPYDQGADGVTFYESDYLVLNPERRKRLRNFRSNPVSLRGPGEP